MSGHGSWSGQKGREQREGNEPQAEPSGYGKPRDMKTALETVNPHYSEDRKYKINCQRCALAYEEQRRGLAVEAQMNDDARLVREGLIPYERGAFWWDSNGSIDAAYAPKGHVGFYNAYEGQSWDRVPRTTSVARAVENLTSALESQGEGSRFMVNVRWRNGGGHVFNAEVVNGTAVFVDAQSGVVRDIASTLERSTINSAAKGVAYSRIDNLKLKKGVADWAFEKI